MVDSRSPCITYQLLQILIFSVSLIDLFLIKTHNQLFEIYFSDNVDWQVDYRSLKPRAKL